MAEEKAREPASTPGARRAAALLLGLGPEVASVIFRQLDEAEVRRIALGAKALRSGGTNAVSEALQSFVEAMERVGGEALVGEDLLRDVAVQALGRDVAQRAFDGVVPPPPPDEVLGPISHADPESLAMVLSREQPQTTALVLSAIEPQRAAGVMEHMPERQRSAVLKRMATIDAVSPEVLREVGQALNQEIRAAVAGGMRKVDGKGAVLEILRRRTSSEQTEVVSEIEKDDPQLAAELRSKLFTFEDLRHLSDRDVQTLLKEVDLNQLTTALKGATPALREKFLRNMSTRAAQMLSDDLSAMGAVRLSVVEQAQTEVVKSARTLAEAERITIVGPADQMV